jgi:glycosyltransferase involved in cell wall biosynthesis
MQVSVEALEDHGVEVEVVAPEGSALRSWARAALRARREDLPLPVARHRDPALQERVAQAVRRERPAAVHVEQIQAVPQAAPARAAGLPVVVRAQNVESDLWRQAARGVARGVVGRLLSRRFARWEGEAVAQADLTIALTEDDRVQLEALAAGRGRVRRLTVPFPPVLPAGEPLAGAPAVSLFVGRGWAPSAEGGSWFVRRVWPEVLRRLPEARLHVFGEIGVARDRPGVTCRAAPEESRSAFPRAGILVVPLRVASGIRMKVLEAWARGLPVVATSRAVRGLEGLSGREWLEADDPRGLAEAIAAAAGAPELRGRLVEGGRRRLAASHAPERFAKDYAAALAGLSIAGR